MKRNVILVLAAVIGTASLSAGYWSKLEKFGQAVDDFLPEYVVEEGTTAPEQREVSDEQELARLEKEKLLEEKKVLLAQRQALRAERAQIQSQKRAQALAAKQKKLEEEQKALAVKQERLEQAERLREERKKLKIKSEEETVLEVEDTVISEDTSDEIQLIEFFSGIRRVANALKEPPFVIKHQVNNERVKGAIHFVRAFAIEVNDKVLNKQYKAICDAYQHLQNGGSLRNSFGSVCNTYAKLSNLNIDIDESLIRAVLEKELVRLKQSLGKGNIGTTLGEICAMHAFLSNQDADLYKAVDSLMKSAYKRAKNPKNFHHLAKEFSPVIEAVQNSNSDFEDE